MNETQKIWKVHPPGLLVTGKHANIRSKYNKCYVESYEINIKYIYDFL